MRHHAALDDHLSNVPLFSTLSLKEREAVRSLLSEVDVPTGARLTREGSIGHEFFIIVSGTASVEHEGVHIADVGPGDYQGELSLLDGGRRTATVTATSPMPSQSRVAARTVRSSFRQQKSSDSRCHARDLFQRTLIFPLTPHPPSSATTCCRTTHFHWGVKPKRSPVSI